MRNIATYDTILLALSKYITQPIRMSQPRIYQADIRMTKQNKP